MASGWVIENWDGSHNMIDVDANLNNFASRCFRDVADRDYIAARMCYRAGLISQFHWSALQAFEKYFKAILLYNRIKAKNIRHDLYEARRWLKMAPFVLRLSDTSEKLLAHLDDYGRFRYLETSYFILGPKLVELDKAVWEVRRYCRVMNYEVSLDNKTSRNMLDFEIRRNNDAESRPFQEFHIAGGTLETIIAKRNHPARKPLVWQNGFYGDSKRKSVRVPTHFYSENSPLLLSPEVLEYVLEYVYIPRDVVRAYREMEKHTSPK